MQGFVVSWEEAGIEARMDGQVDEGAGYASPRHPRRVLTAIVLTIDVSRDPDFFFLPNHVEFFFLIASSSAWSCVLFLALFLPPRSFLSHF